MILAAVVVIVVVVHAPLESSLVMAVEVKGSREVKWVCFAVVVLQKQ